MANTTTLLAHTELIAEIRRFSYEGRTGTIFITSDEGHLARIVLDGGRITYLTFGTKYRGYDAIPLIQAIKSGRLQFSDGIFETAQEAPLPSTSEIFQKLSPNLPHIETTHVQSASEFSGAVEQIKKALAIYIGPFAIIACEDYIKKLGSPKTKGEVVAMIDIVAPEIEKEDQRQAFKEQLKETIFK